MYAWLFQWQHNLTPELLLLDEVLAVGDAGFQQKSYAKMKELLTSGATIILVSHDARAITEMCKRAIWLDHGAGAYGWSGRSSRKILFKYDHPLA